MPFKVANSSFIFDLRLRSITLCAVFLAIFLPATLVELGCFLPPPLPVFDPPTAFLLLAFELRLKDAPLISSDGCDLGFI